MTMLENIINEGIINSFSDNNFLEEQLQKFEKKNKISYLYLKEYIFDFNEKWIIDLEDNTIWIFIPIDPDARSRGKFFKLENLCKIEGVKLENIRNKFSKFNPPKEDLKDRRIKIELSSFNDLFNFITELKILMKNEKISFELKKKTKSGIITKNLFFDNEESLKSILNNEITDYIDFLNLKVNFGEDTQINFEIKNEKDVLNITTLFKLDEFRPNILNNYKFDLKYLYKITKKSNGFVLIKGEKYDISHDYKLLKLNWFPIEEWYDFPVKLEKEKSKIEIGRYSVELIFNSFEDFYSFINELINYCKLDKNSIEVYYKWEEEERNNRKVVNIESLDKFIDSLVVKHYGKHYNEVVIINDTFEFEYSYNLGYREITYFNKDRGVYEHDIIFLGIPTKVKFETKISLDDDSSIRFNNLKLPFSFFENFKEKLS